MKITKQQLRKLIKEELLKEEYPSQLLARAGGALQELKDDLDNPDPEVEVKSSDVRLEELRQIIITLYNMAKMAKRN
jgi:hypothetical protein